MTPDTIKQRRLEVDLGEGRKVVVRRMRWKAAREFMLALAAQIRALGLIGKIDLVLLVEKIGELIRGTESLVALLVTSTTDLTAEQVDELDLLELAQVIDAAIELNLGADLKNCWTGIGQRIAGLVGASASVSTTMPSMAPSTPTSSMPATAPSI